MASIINTPKLVLTVLPLSLSSSRQCLPLSFKLNGGGSERGEEGARSRLGVVAGRRERKEWRREELSAENVEGCKGGRRVCWVAFVAQFPAAE